MRNRVARTPAGTLAAATSRLVLVTALVPGALVVMAQGASATTLADDEVVAQSVTYGFAGPIGIAAVVLGFGGLVLGLLRHRRREMTAASGAVVAGASGAAPPAGSVTLPVDASGALPVLDAAQPAKPAAGDRVG